MNFIQLAVVLFAAVGSLCYGYCAGVITTSLGQPSFLSYFNIDSATTENQAMYRTSIIVCFQCGGLFGALGSPYIADRFGRKFTMLIASVLVIITSALQAGSVNIAMFLVFRTLGGFAIGGILVAVPLYQAEIAPVHIRGRLIAMHGVMLAVGYVVAAWLNLAFFYVPNSALAWRIPLAIQVTFPLVLLMGLSVLPESPRWLITNGQKEKAKNILLRLHSTSSDPNNEVVENEYCDIVEANLLAQTKSTTWKDIATIPSYRRRSLLSFCCLFIYPATGTLTLTNYMPSLLSNLNFEPSQQLVLSAGYMTYSPVGNLLAAYIIDKYGRKNMLLTGMAGCVACLIGEIVSITHGLQSKAGQVMGVVFLFLHLFFFATFCDGTTFVYSSEIWPQHLRAKGVSIGIVGLFVSSIIWLGSSPTGFDSIHQYYYIAYVVVTVLLMIFIYFVWPETGRVPLEHIGALFGDPIHAPSDNNCSGSGSENVEVENNEKGKGADNVVPA